MVLIGCLSPTLPAITARTQGTPKSTVSDLTINWCHEIQLQEQVRAVKLATRKGTMTHMPKKFDLLISWNNLKEIRSDGPDQLENEIPIRIVDLVKSISS